MAKHWFYNKRFAYPVNLLLFLLVMPSSCNRPAQNTEPKPRTMAELELRGGYYYLTEENRLFNGSVREEFANGYPRLYGTIEKGKWHGEYYEHFENGDLKTQIIYEKGIEQPGGFHAPENGTETTPGDISGDGTATTPGDVPNVTPDQESTRHNIIETIQSFSTNKKPGDLFSASCKAIFTDPATLVFSFLVNDFQVYEYSFNLMGIKGIDIVPDNTFADKELFLYKLKITTDPAYRSTVTRPGHPPSEVNLVEILVVNPEIGQNLAQALQHLGRSLLGI